MERPRKPFIRAVARSSTWKLRYRVSIRTGINLFNKSILELNINQLRLLEWLEFYKCLDEMEEKPSAEMMEYDILVDYWLENFLSKKKRENKYSKIGREKKTYQNTLRFND